MTSSHPARDLVTSRFPSWMACRDDPFKCDFNVSATHNRPEVKKTGTPRTPRSRIPRRKMVHRLDSDDREPPPLPRKIPKTSVGSPGEDIENWLDEWDGASDCDSTPGPLDYLSEDAISNWKGEIERRLPLSLPKDLEYAIATIGSEFMESRISDANTEMLPLIDVTDNGAINGLAMHPAPSNLIDGYLSPFPSDSESSSPTSSSSETEIYHDARCSLGSLSDVAGSEETAKPASPSQDESVVEFDARLAMDNLSKRLSNGASSSTPAGIACGGRFAPDASINTRDDKHRLSSSFSLSPVHADELPNRSSCSEHGSNSVKSETDTSSVELRVSIEEMSLSNGSSDRGTTLKMESSGSQRNRQSDSANLLRTTRSLDRRFLFGFSGSRVSASETYSVRPARSHGQLVAKALGKAPSPQQTSNTRERLRLKSESTSSRRQSRISGLWFKFKDHIPAAPPNVPFS